MAADTPIRRRHSGILSRNLLVTGGTIVVAVVEFTIAVKSFTVPVVNALMGPALAIGLFIALCGAYQPTQSRVVRWGILLEIVSYIVIIGVYEVLLPVLSHFSAGLVAVILTPIALSVGAIGIARRHQP